MTDAIWVLFGALAVLGVAVYGLVQVIKPLPPAEWRKYSRLGRATFKAAPLLLGAMVSVAALPNTMDLLCHLVSLECALPVLSLSSKALLGTASGTLSTTIHSVVRSRVSKAIQKVDNVA